MKSRRRAFPVSRERSLEFPALRQSNSLFTIA